MIVLDTNVLSELILPTPHSRVLAWINAQRSSDLVITAITAAELRVGVAYLPVGNRRRELHERVEKTLLKTFARAVLAFGLEASEQYASVRADRRAAGRPIEIPDAQIAAICRQYSATLATRNVRDFEDTGIETLNPWDSHPGP